MVAYDTHHLIEAIDQLVLPFIETLYSRFGYAGVLIAMAIESAAIPLPSELILPFAGWSVSRGLIEPMTGSPWTYWGAVIAGVIGNTVGSLASYAVGALGGRPILERYGRYVLISAHDLEVADRWFARWGDLTVLFSRMLPIVRTFISLPAGAAKMPIVRFSVLTFLGALPWNTGLVLAGYAARDNWEDLRSYLHLIDYAVVAAIVVGGVWLGLRWWRGRGGRPAPNET